MDICTAKGKINYLIRTNTLAVVTLLIGKEGVNVFALLYRSCNKNNSCSGPISTSFL